MEKRAEEMLLDAGIRVVDIDREIAFTLLSVGCDFERREIDKVVAYFLRIEGTQVGRFVIAPGTGGATNVRIREHFSLGEDGGVAQALQDRIADLRARVWQAVEALVEMAPWSEGEAIHGTPSEGLTRHPSALGDSSHFAYPRRKRLEIVRHYRTDRLNGDIVNKDHWARQNYQISGRTLLNYEREFPEVID